MKHLFPPESHTHRFSPAWILGIVAVVVLAAGSYLAWSLYSQFTDDSSKLQQLQAVTESHTRMVAALQRRLSEREQSIAELKDELQQRIADATDLKNQLIQREAELEEAHLQLTRRGGITRVRLPHDELAQLLRLSNIRAMSLAGSDLAKQAAGILLYDAQTQKVWLYTVNLPECPNGTTYQLWAMQEKPVSLGTFHMEAGETTHLLVNRLQDFARAKTFAVSLEPSGGRPKPTGAVYLASQSY
jgi:hypothetical protein